MGHSLCFVLGKAAPKDDGYGGGGGDGELSLCKIPTRRKFNCSVSD